MCIPFVGPWPLFQFPNPIQSRQFFDVGISPRQGLYPHIVQHKQNKRSEAYMPQVGFESTIPAFYWRIVHAFDRAAIEIDNKLILGWSN
jgi:hypothetical protein